MPPSLYTVSRPPARSLYTSSRPDRFSQFGVAGTGWNQVTGAVTLRSSLTTGRPSRGLSGLRGSRCSIHAPVTRSLKRSAGNRGFTSAATAVVGRHTSTPHVPGSLPPSTSSRTTAILRSTCCARESSSSSRSGDVPSTRAINSIRSVASGPALPFNAAGKNTGSTRGTTSFFAGSDGSGFCRVSAQPAQRIAAVVEGDCADTVAKAKSAARGTPTMKRENISECRATARMVPGLLGADFWEKWRWSSARTQHRRSIDGSVGPEVTDSRGGA